MRSLPLSICCFTLLLLGNFCQAQTAPAPQTQTVADPAITLTFTCSLNEEDRGFPLLERLYQRTFHNLGMGFKMESLPRMREQYALAEGRFDGSCGRLDGPPFSNNPQLIRLDIPLVSYHIALIGTVKATEIKTLKQVPQGTTIAYVRGAESMDRIMELLPQANIVNAPNILSAMKMVATGRSDLFLHAVQENEQTFTLPGIDMTFKVILPLSPQKIYTYLNIRHAHLKSKIEAELKTQLPQLYREAAALKAGQNVNPKPQTPEQPLVPQHP